MKAEGPFDFATTPGKLPKQVVPTDYAIRIVPNIEKVIFTGTETVKLSVRALVICNSCSTPQIEIGERCD